MPTSFVVEENGSKILSFTSSGTPGPSSLISKVTHSRSGSCQVRTTRTPRPCAEHRLFSVDDQVQQHLLQLMRIAEGVRQAGCQRFNHAEVRHALLVGAQCECRE